MDTLVLGCTHYPLLKPIIAEIMGPAVTLVDSADETARTVAEILREKKLLRPASEKGNHHYYVSDIPAGFIRVGNRFLGGQLGDVYQVSLEECRMTDGEGAGIMTPGRRIGVDVVDAVCDHCAGVWRADLEEVP